MTYHEKLYRVWGQYLNYPQCCIDDFVERVAIKGEGLPKYAVDSPFYQSGYVPCKCCHNKTKSMTKEQAFKWFGRDPLEEYIDRKTHLQTTLDKVNTEKFQSIACNYDFDVVEYGLWIEQQLEEL
ncbi:hypothetical protein VP14_080 [Vibrio phage VPMCC14]|nr:hypothetical protein VP14_080 [Vibrio phage VPMCC14]